MTGVRFQATAENSFFGDFLYEQVLDKKHFLVRAKELLDWSALTQKCLPWYQGGAETGRPPYEPAIMLRMLFLSYLYNTSERAVELMANDSLSMKYFLGLGVNQDVPDHSSLTYFKRRLLEGGGQKAFDGLFLEILGQAKTLGIRFGALQTVDATHTLADVNTVKDKQRQTKAEKPPRDPDAKWGAKHTKIFKDPGTGKEIKQTEYFFGYKAHLSLNLLSGLLTAVTTTSGEKPDNGQFKTLVGQDEQTPVPKQRTYAGDRGYDDGDLHTFLESRCLGDALKLKSTRLHKKDGNKAPWQKLIQSDSYQSGLKQRFRIEQKNGEMKTGHGLRRCRYLGLRNYHAQATLTAMVLNLKVVVAKMTGSTLRGYRHRSFGNPDGYAPPGLMTAWSSS